jgi:hypothetical protein
MQEQSVGQSSTPRDEEMAKALQSQRDEAAERVTFHRVELERWTRIGRAASAGLNHLSTASPVSKMPSDGFLDDQPETTQAPRHESW